MRLTRLDKSRLQRFSQYWDDLFKVVPEARRQAAEAMGDAVLAELNRQISVSIHDSNGHIQDLQGVRIGSHGGYAAVSPRKGTVEDRTNRGQPVTAKQLTSWLDRGHATRRPAGKTWTFRKMRGQSITKNYVHGGRFYSEAQSKATEIAIRAADKVLSAIADEVDY